MTWVVSAGESRFSTVEFYKQRTDDLLHIPPGHCEIRFVCEIRKSSSKSMTHAVSHSANWTGFSSSLISAT